MKRAVFLRTSSKPIPRVKRVALVADELGYSTLFVGAYRDNNLPASEQWDGLDVQRVGKFYPMLNGAGFFTYLKGVFNYNVGAYRLLKAEKPSLIHFSDVESFFAVFFYRFFKKIPVIYNIHDNFSQRYPLPRWINGILNIFEGLIVKYSTVTLVPEEFRANALPSFCRKKVKVVKNTPVDPGFSHNDSFDPEKIKIVFAGWLDEGRGITTLLDLAKSNDKVEIHVAGEGSQAIINRLKNVPNCKYYGFLNHEQVLKLTKDCDFVFAHYSPKRIINIFAAPNKLAEALAVGRPVIINSETKVSQPVIENNCGVVTHYGDSKAILDQLENISKDNSNYTAMCTRARELFDKSYSWDKVKSKTLQIINSLEVK